MLEIKIVDFKAAKVVKETAHTITVLPDKSDKPRSMQTKTSRIPKAIKILSSTST